MADNTRGGFSFPGEYRLHRAAEFRKVRHGGGWKRHTPHFLILVMNKGCGSTRLGLTVSRKIGGAVQRNRVKRLLREFFRLHYTLLPHHSDISIIAKRGASGLDFAAVRGELKVLLTEGREPGTSCSKD